MSTSTSTENDMDIIESLLSLLERHPLAGNSESNDFFGYGTAGFRYKINVMEGIVVRVGICCALLLYMQMQQQQQEQQEKQQETSSSSSNSSSSSSPSSNCNMGIMLTASHNDESYNGVKVSNPDGSMINEHQETFLVEWVNQRNLQIWKQYFIDLITKQQNQKQIESTTSSSTTNVPYLLHVGRDTRSHSPSFAKLLIQGAQETMKLLNNNKINNNNNDNDNNFPLFQIVNHGIVTTPMLHHVVLHSNPMYLPPTLVQTPLPTREGYLNLLAQTYCDLIVALEQQKQSANATKSTATASPIPLRIDCACGVGYEAVQQCNDKIQQILLSQQQQQSSNNVVVTTAMPILQPWNGPNDGPLNTNCGSEHVQKQLQPPTWYDHTNQENNNNNNNTNTSIDDTSYCCSVDGDADRIVFFSQPNNDTTDTNSDMILLDGDKIAVLLATFFKQQQLPETLSMGVVQTAYANGASTHYLKNTLHIPVIITKTGVKHLHHAAIHHFDVGIYFEANGHGTVIFGPKFYQQCNNKVLLLVAKLINPAVGDALSDLLLVNAILQHSTTMMNTNNDTSSSLSLLQHWNDSLYQDLPSRQLKVQVQDRSVVICNDNETKCIAPTSLQPALDELMANGGPYHRCFVRASGTENVVRVYAEAPTRDEADRLASATAQLVQIHCGGGIEPLSSKI